MAEINKPFFISLLLKSITDKKELQKIVADEIEKLVYDMKSFNVLDENIINYSVDQWFDIIELYSDFQSITNPFSFKREFQLEQIDQGIQQGLDVSLYAKPEFDYSQMAQIRQGLEDHLDVSFYAKPEFNNMQMIQIRNGLEDGIDVSLYAKPEFSWEQMKQMREKLIAEKNKEKGRGR